jgi:hypothetical protein
VCFTHGLGAKGTVVNPLDGGALSLAGNALAGEGTRAGTATSLWAAMDGDLGFLRWKTQVWVGGGGKRSKGGGDDRRTTTGGACPHYHRRPPATALCPAAAVVQHEGARGGNELGFSGEPAESGGFCSAEMHGWSSIAMDGRELPEPTIPVFSPGGRSARAVSAARSLVVGLQAQACTRLRSWTDHGVR